MKEDGGRKVAAGRAESGPDNERRETGVWGLRREDVSLRHGSSHIQLLVSDVKK